ncbi:MAG: hypothetical protein NTW97_01070, partial [Candidatus Krumholzibacteria bacterium]|nr:hypothetical protein [Candidatus Krumholzibacteria bacterium]
MVSIMNPPTCHKRFPVPPREEFSRPAVRFENVIERIDRTRRVRPERFLDPRDDREKSDPSREKGLHGDFIGGIQHRRRRSAALRRREGERVRRVFIAGKGREFEPSELIEAEGAPRKLPHVRIVQGAHEGQLHIGRPEVRDEGSVAQAHDRMDDRLRVRHDLDRVVGKMKKPVGLDHLEPLVEKIRRIDRHLRSHLPGRMVEDLLDGDVGKIRLASSVERPSRRGQDDLDRLVPVSAQAAREGE